MKSALFAKALTITAALAIALTPGCRRKPKEPITPLPAGARTGIQNPQPGGPGGLTDRTSPLTDPSALGGTDLGATNLKPGEDIGLGDAPPDRSQYTEDRSQFAASTVYFDFDSSVVKIGEKAKLTAVIDYLRANARAAVEVEGHCDERGTEEYNRSLGERRALSLREEIALSGIDPKRVFTISYGEDRPAVAGHGESSWSRNRRGEFVLLTPR